MSILKKVARYFARKEFCREAIHRHADLSAFKEKINISIVTGLILIGLSYATGLPTVVAFGAIAASMNKPLVGIIGGALIYGISTLMFFIGVKMAGTKYFIAFSSWVVRVSLEKMLGDEVKTIVLPPVTKTEENHTEN